jgi:hypothetical protein
MLSLSHDKVTCMQDFYELLAMSLVLLQHFPCFTSQTQSDKPNCKTINMIDGCSAGGCVTWYSCGYLLWPRYGHQERGRSSRKIISICVIPYACKSLGNELLIPIWARCKENISVFISKSECCDLLRAIIPRTVRIPDFLYIATFGVKLKLIVFILQQGVKIIGAV